jgi:hypothetical protein
MERSGQKAHLPLIPTSMSGSLALLEAGIDQKGEHPALISLSPSATRPGIGEDDCA